MDSKGQEINEKFYDYHYTLSTYINMAIESGFTIVSVEEVGYSDPDVANRNNVPQEFRRFPQSFIVTTKKSETSKK